MNRLHGPLRAAKPRGRLSPRSTGNVLCGLEALAKKRPKFLKERRVGLLMHPASIGRSLTTAREILRDLCGKNLVALFGPQHGFLGEKQDNMIESPHVTDGELGIPIYSLYAEKRAPTPEMLDGIDVLVVDLQDVGTRVYTFEWTTALALEACAEAGKKIVILDRPNPIGGTIMEGNLIRPGYESFVGLYPVPMRHAMTLGEMACLVAHRFAQRRGSSRCDLEVFPMQGWRRSMLWEDTGMAWVLPSPNMPTPDTARVYPGQVLLEGTNLSEGRGTTRPFELWGAPWLDTGAFLQRFLKRDLPGFVLRPHAFEPTFHKWKGQVCHGFQIHVTDVEKYKPYLTTVAMLQDVVALHADIFEWRQPPYEYVTDKPPIDVLTGDPVLRGAIETGADLGEFETAWKKEIREFAKEAKSYFLYPA